MPSTDMKWHCRCGQINAPIREQCVNCNGPRSEGSDRPFGQEEIEVSGRPVAPGRYCGMLARRFLDRPRIHADPQMLTVTERRTGAWIVFIFFAVVSAGVTLLLLRLGVGNDLGPFLAPALVCTPTLLIGALVAFPHERIVVSRPDQYLEVQHRWLCFTRSRQPFSLHEFRVGPGRLTVQVREQHGIHGGVALLSLLCVCGWVLILGKDDDPWEASFTTVSITSGPGGDAYHLFATHEEQTVYRVLAEIRQLLPDAVVDEVRC
jgi:hypothetical protein